MIFFSVFFLLYSSGLFCIVSSVISRREVLATKDFSIPQHSYISPYTDDVCADVFDFYQCSFLENVAITLLDRFERGSKERILSSLKENYPIHNFITRDIETIFDKRLQQNDREINSTFVQEMSSYLRVL